MQSILLFTLLITLYPLACLWLQPANNNKRLIMNNWLEIRVKNDHRSKFSNLSNWKIYCDDHSSLSPTTAVQKWIISYTSHHDSKLLLFYDKVNPLDYSKIVLWGRVFWLGTKPPTCYGIHSTKVSGENFKEVSWHQLLTTSMNSPLRILKWTWQMLGQTASIHSVLTSGNLGTWRQK